ncbi:MAG: GNAT family N-acetyltransferase [Rhizobiales bacterium]|nr:GNAT family N-acetyltransferase [Hyphomicrobiales bacterium]
MTAATYDIHPATSDRWPDFESLMGVKGGVGGCWCMLWRYTKRDYDAAGPQGRHAAMADVFAAERPPGLLAYVDGAPVGWCSLAPRAAFPRLATSRVLAPVDEAEVWSVTCFFIARSHRRKGLSVQLLNAASAFAARHGARILEGYPNDPQGADYPAAYSWIGLASAYRKAGFQEVARRSPTRPVMRRRLP